MLRRPPLPASPFASLVPDRYEGNDEGFGSEGKSGLPIESLKRISSSAFVPTRLVGTLLTGRAFGPVGLPLPHLFCWPWP